MEERLQSHYALLARSIEFTRMADAKAAPVIFVNLALLGALSARFSPLLEILKVDAWGTVQVVVLALIVLWLCSVAAAIFVAARVYMPATPLTGSSLIYFEDIAKMSRDSYVANSVQLSAASIEQQLLDQAFRVSQIASAKMHRVKRAFILTIPSIFLAVVLLAFGSV